MGDQDYTSKEHQTKDHYWEYFDSMTTQRTQVFYFYVVIASLFWTGLGATESRLFSDLQNQKDTKYIAEMIILCFFIAVTFVFYMIEERCIQIVKFAECYIIKHGSESDKRLFKLEPESRKICGIKFSFKTAYSWFFSTNLIGAVFVFSYFWYKETVVSSKNEVDTFILVILYLIANWGLAFIGLVFIGMIAVIGYVVFMYKKDYCILPQDCPCRCKKEKEEYIDK